MRESKKTNNEPIFGKEKLGLMRAIKLKNIGQISEVHAGDKIRKKYLFKIS